MIGILINLVIVLLIIGVVWYLITTLLPLVPLPGPIGQIVHALLVAIFALVIIFYVLIPLLHQVGSRTLM